MENHSKASEQTSLNCPIYTRFQIKHVRDKKELKSSDGWRDHSSSKAEGGSRCNTCLFLVTSHNIRILPMLAGRAAVQATTKTQRQKNQKGARPTRRRLRPLRETRLVSRKLGRSDSRAGITILTRFSTRLELRDLLRDPLFALRIGESWCHMLFALRSPVFVFVGGLEGGIRADGGISVGVDLLNVVRTNTVL